MGQQTPTESQQNSLPGPPLESGPGRPAGVQQSDLLSALLRWVDTQKDVVAFAYDKKSKTILYASSAALSLIGSERPILGQPLHDHLFIEFPSGKLTPTSRGTIPSMGERTVLVKWQTPLSRLPLPRQGILLLEGTVSLLILRKQEDSDESTPSEDQSGLPSPQSEYFVSQIVHELRNPLAGITTTIERIATGEDLSPGAKDACERLTREVYRADSFLKNITSLFRPQGSQPGRSNLGKVLQQCIERHMDMFLEQNIELDCDPSQIDVWVQMIEPRLVSVLQNVMLNALQAMKGQPSGSLSISHQELSGQKLCHLRFSDTGPGIPPHYVERVFEPFWSRRSGGTGLGLAVVNRFMTECGGEVSLESRQDTEGQGTSVNLLFPTL